MPDIDINHDKAKTKLIIRKLILTARQGIDRHYEPETGLFDYIVSDYGIAEEKKRLLLTHSLISLLGITSHGGFLNSQYPQSIDLVFRMVRYGEGGIRERALLLWLLAKNNDPRAGVVFKYIKSLSPLALTRAKTMELAWVLTACIYEYARNFNTHARKKVLELAQLLKARFVKETGLFLHRDHKCSKWDIRYSIANLTDQIFPIYALAQFTRHLRDERYLKIADQCAQKLCSQQGELGQWWWHYHALTGEVVERYPVLSVHQDAMVPMAFMALNRVSLVDYNPYIVRGLHWLAKENKLNTEMINEERHFIRRGIKRTLFRSKVRKLVTIAAGMNLMDGIPAKYDQPKYLSLMNWEHSYHLGWILYAYNGETENMWHQLQ